MASSTALLQRKELLGSESLVVDLTGGLNQILKVSSGQEIAQGDEFAMVFIFDVDNTPSILTATDLSATDGDGLFASDNSKRDDVFDCGVERTFFIIEFIVVIWVHLEVVECKFFLDALLEGSALFEGKRVGLGDHGNDIDDIGELLQNNNIDWFQGVTRGLDEEETAVDTGVLDVSVALRGKFLS